MSGTAMPQLAAALYARLTGDSSVTALVTGVFDAVPDAQQVPFIAIGDFTEVPNKAFGRGGHELTATLHLYDQDGITFGGVAARGMRRILGILEAVVQSLEAMTGSSVAAHSLVEVTYEWSTPLKEDDGAGGVYRHVPARFRIVLEDA